MKKAIIAIIIVVLVIIGVIFGIKAIDKGSTDSWRNNAREKQFAGLAKLEYKIPDEFIDKKDEKSVIVVEYNYSENEMICSISIQCFSKNEFNFEGLVENVTSDLEKYDTILKNEDIEINGAKTRYVLIESDLDGTSEGLNFHYLVNKNYYFIESDEYIYKVVYNVTDKKNGNREDLETHICTTSLDPFLESIKVK